MNPILADTDLFQLTFETLRSSLLSHENNDDDRLLDCKFSRIIREDLTAESSNRHSEICSYREPMLEKLCCDSRKFRTRERCVETCHKSSYENCEKFALAVQRRMKCQVTAAEKRMQELSFEIIAEYGKSELRLLRRQEYLNYAGQLGIAWAAWKLIWNRFLCRLCFDMGIMQLSSTDGRRTSLDCKIMCPKEDRDELRKILAKVKKRMVSIQGDRIQLVTAVRIVKLREIGLSHTSSSSCKSIDFASAEYVDDWRNLANILQDWSNPGLTGSSGWHGGAPHSSGPKTQSNRRQQDTGASSTAATCRAMSFLKSHVISWLHPPSYQPIHFDILATNIHHRVVPSPAQTAKVNCTNNRSSSNDSGPTRLPRTVSPQISGGVGANALGQMDLFISRFCMQHTAQVMTERIYFCLEERAMADLPIPPVSASTTAMTSPRVDDGSSLHVPVNENIHLMEALQQLQVRGSGIK